MFRGWFFSAEDGRTAQTVILTWWLLKDTESVVLIFNYTFITFSM